MIKDSGLSLIPIISLVAGLIVLAGALWLIYQPKFAVELKQTASTAVPSPTSTPPPPVPTSSPRDEVSKPTVKPTTKPITQSGNFSCTLFIGYSQTNNWFPEFHSAKGNTVEMQWIGGGAARYWVDSGYSGWAASKSFPCAQNKDTPDRVVFDVTHDEYLNQVSDPVGKMKGIIQQLIPVIKSKYPSARKIVVQPVTGGPNNGTCQFNGKDVRASINHPFIGQAIDTVVGGDVSKGNNSQVGNCSQYADDIGHLNGNGQSYLGQQNANFF